MFSVMHGIEGRERIAANRSSSNPQYSLARKNDAKVLGRCWDHFRWLKDLRPVFLLNGELLAVITGDEQNQGGLTSFQFLPVCAFAAIRLVMKLEMELFELSRRKQLRRHTYWSSSLALASSVKALALASVKALVLASVKALLLDSVRAFALHQGWCMGNVLSPVQWGECQIAV
ncbi:unnamed protein product [Sphagnum jensenii]